MLQVLRRKLFAAFCTLLAPWFTLKLPPVGLSFLSCFKLRWIPQSYLLYDQPHKHLHSHIHEDLFKSPCNKNTAWTVVSTTQFLKKVYIFLCSIMIDFKTLMTFSFCKKQTSTMRYTLIPCFPDIESGSNFRVTYSIRESTT